MIQPFLTVSQLRKIVKKIAEDIAFDYSHPEVPPILLIVLKGSFLFASDLFRELYHEGIKAEIDFIKTSSYIGTTRGPIQISEKLGLSLKGKDVIIVEDIIDSGVTISAIKQKLITAEPKSIEVAALFCRGNSKCKYVGKHLKDEFVVGYGLDLNEDYRYLPYVGVYQQGV